MHFQTILFPLNLQWVIEVNAVLAGQRAIALVALLSIVVLCLTTLPQSARRWSFGVLACGELIGSATLFSGWERISALILASSILLIFWIISFAFRISASLAAWCACVVSLLAIAIAVPKMAGAIEVNRRWNDRQNGPPQVLDGNSTQQKE